MGYGSAGNIEAPQPLIGTQMVASNATELRGFDGKSEEVQLDENNARVRSTAALVPSPACGVAPPRGIDAEILDLKAAARLLGFSKSHLSKLLAGKFPDLPTLPHVRVGRTVRIRRGAIVEWFHKAEGVHSDRTKV